MQPGYAHGVVAYLSSLLTNLTLSITSSHALMSLAMIYLMILSPRIVEVIGLCRPRKHLLPAGQA